MKSFKDQQFKDQQTEELNKKVKLDEATAGDFLLGLGAAGGLLALKKGWDKWGKGSKLAKSFAFTDKQKAKVAQDKIDKSDEKEKEKETMAKADTIGLDKDEEGNLKNQKDAQAYKDKTGKAPSGWESSPENSPGKGKVWTKDDQTKWDADAKQREADKETKAAAIKQKKIDKEKKTGQANKAQRDKRASGKTGKSSGDAGSLLKLSPAEKAARIAAAKKKRADRAGSKEEFSMFVKEELLIDLTEEDRTQLLKELVLEETMTITESNELQAIMALDDAGIKAEINRKGEVVVKKKDLKKAQKALKGSFKKGGEPKLIGEGVLEDGTTEMANQYKNDTPGQAGDDLIKVIEMQMSAAAKKKKDLWKKSAGGKKSLLKSKKRAKKVSSGAIKIDKARGRSMAKARAKGGIRNEFELGEELELNEKEKHAGWIAFYNKDKLEIKNSEADGLYDAKLLAIKHFKVPKSKQGLLAIEPAYEEFEITEALGKLDKSVIDAFYYKKEKAGTVVSTDGDTLMKNGMGGQTIAQWLKPSGKIAISAVTDVKSTESILKYMKKSIPKGNFDKKSYKSFFGEELQRTAYELVSEARKKAAANKPQWEQE